MVLIRVEELSESIVLQQRVICSFHGELTVMDERVQWTSDEVFVIVHTGESVHIRSWSSSKAGCKWKLIFIKSKHGIHIRNGASDDLHHKENG